VKNIKYLLFKITVKKKKKNTLNIKTLRIPVKDISITFFREQFIAKDFDLRFYRTFSKSTEKNIRFFIRLF